MNKKKNIVIILSFLIIIAVISGVYHFLNKKIVDLKTEQEQQNQDIKRLITFNWKTYQNKDFNLYFYLKHPEYVYICDEDNRPNGIKLLLQIYVNETCEIAKQSRDGANTQFIIKDNINNYKTAEEAFYSEIKTLSPNFDKSLNQHLGYFKFDKFDAYGGEIINKTHGTWVTRSNNYLAVIIKNNYVIKISDSYYDVIVDGKQNGDKFLVDEIISSIYFDTLNYWK
ncbi:hypothetical protein HZC33_03240 [Candidatus Wolfebacteria bacterium]|nr:hypothetical protein [Candidatus Wolfebacteria bacterium]